MHKFLRATPKPKSNDKRSGAALVLVSLFLAILIPIMGLAVDGANVYIMNSQITTAMQAAVLAGTRNLNKGSDFGKSVAVNTWRANVAGMSSKILWNSSTDPGAALISVVPHDSDHYQSVTGSVTATLPLLLMPILPGVSTTTTPIVATAKKRDVNLMLVLDTSNLMGNLGTYGVPLDLAVNAVLPFVDGFSDGRDNVGVVSLSTGAFLANDLSPLSPPAPFSANVNATLNNLYSGAPNYYLATGYPNISAAIWLAYQRLLALNQPNALNVIVLFTNDVPAAFTANYSSSNFENAAQIAAQVAAIDPSVRSTAYVGPVCSSSVTGVLSADQLNLDYAGLSDQTEQFLGDTPEYRPPQDSSGNPLCYAEQADGSLYPYVITNPGATSYGTLVTMPSTDIFNFSTVGSYASPSMTRDPVLGFAVSDVIGAAGNAADNAGYAIRTSTSLPGIAIYAIGMINDLSIKPDPRFMCRLANDPDPQWAGVCTYDPAQTQGKYVSADLTSGNTAALTAAFASVASSVLQLTRDPIPVGATAQH
jgi:hypothetical protein